MVEVESPFTDRRCPAKQLFHDSVIGLRSEARSFLK
jgi:hypothetical protein